MIRDTIDEGSGLALPPAITSKLTDPKVIRWAHFYLNEAAFLDFYRINVNEYLGSQEFSSFPPSFWQALIPQYCNFISLMTLGESIFDLALQAQNGNDKALFKVVQIDKTALHDMPCIRERITKAQLSSEGEFMRLLSNAIKAPSLRQKVRYPLLMLLFAILDEADLLNMPLDDLMDVCEEAEVYGESFGVFDKDSLRKRRSYYLRNKGPQT